MNELDHATIERMKRDATAYAAALTMENAADIEAAVASTLAMIRTPAVRMRQQTALAVATVDVMGGRRVDLFGQDGIASRSTFYGRYWTDPEFRQCHARLVAIIQRAEAMRQAAEAAAAIKEHRQAAGELASAIRSTLADMLATPVNADPDDPEAAAMNWRAGDVSRLAKTWMELRQVELDLQRPTQRHDVDVNVSIDWRDHLPAGVSIVDAEQQMTMVAKLVAGELAADGSTVDDHDPEALAERGRLALQRRRQQQQDRSDT